MCLWSESQDMCVTVRYHCRVCGLSVAATIMSAPLSLSKTPLLRLRCSPFARAFIHCGSHSHRLCYLDLSLLEHFMDVIVSTQSRWPREQAIVG
jgi:hypothetical protein